MGFGTSISFKVLPVSSFDSGDDEMRRGALGKMAIFLSTLK
jgi:hypothetical protein